MPRPARDWRMLPPMRVSPETEAAIEAAAREAEQTVTEWRRAAYRAALRRSRKATPSPPE